MNKVNILGVLNKEDFSRFDNFENSIKIHFKDENTYQSPFKDFINKANKLGLLPSKIALDLFFLANIVFCADTRINRKKNSQDGWTREININLIVSDVVFWNDKIAQLEEMLNFLTGDIWKFNFLQNNNENDNKDDKTDLNKDYSNIDTVSLFSGGLDSFIGAIDLLKKDINPIFVGHFGDNKTSNDQKKCKLALDQIQKDILFLQSRIVFPKEINIAGIENTQRSRSFLFFCMGIYVANSLHVKNSKEIKLYVPENGFIALNVPLDPFRLGALSTRTVHPFYINKFNSFLRNGNFGVQIENPYKYKTKGEMIKDCLDKNLLKEHISETMSCSAPGKYRFERVNYQHCGHCVPCIIRRSAVLSSGFEENTIYSKANKNQSLERSAQIEHFKSFIYSSKRVIKNPKIAKVMIHKSGYLNDFSSEEDLENYSSMYLRGVNEIWNFVKDIKIEKA